MSSLLRELLALVFLLRLMLLRMLMPNESSMNFLVTLCTLFIEPWHSVAPLEQIVGGLIFSLSYFRFSWFSAAPLSSNSIFLKIGLSTNEY